MTPFIYQVKGGDTQRTISFKFTVSFTVTLAINFDFGQSLLADQQALLLLHPPHNLPLHLGLTYRKYRYLMKSLHVCAFLLPEIGQLGLLHGFVAVRGLPNGQGQ